MVILLYVVVTASACIRVKGPGGSKTDWDIFRLLIKDNPGSQEVVGVGLWEKMRVSVVTTLSGCGQDLRGIRRVSTESARFAVIDVDLKLSGFADIADEVIPGVIPVSPA